MCVCPLALLQPLYDFFDKVGVQDLGLVDVLSSRLEAFGCCLRRSLEMVDPIRPYHFEYFSGFLDSHGSVICKWF